jgi:TfoX/Sxy family transcriptional regulator of competence genes
MTPDQDLAAHVRSVLAEAGAIHEVKMFGGIGFMLNGNMVAAASRRGLLLRVGKDRYREALSRSGARAMEMRGRVMEGYLYVDPAVLDDHSLRDWLQLAVAFVQTLPAKLSTAKAKRQKGRSGHR